MTKQRSREPDDHRANDDHSNSMNVQSPVNDIGEPAFKKLILEEIISSDTGSKCSTPSEQACGVPDGTGCWPDSIVHWPLEAFAENLCQDLFSQKWEVRHGAATALRELIRLHGKGTRARYYIYCIYFVLSLFCNNIKLLNVFQTYRSRQVQRSNSGRNAKKSLSMDSRRCSKIIVRIGTRSIRRLRF